MTTHQTLTVALDERSYPIHIGELSVWALGGRIRVPMGLPDEQDPSVGDAGSVT